MFVPVFKVPAQAILATLILAALASSGCEGTESHAAASSAPLPVETIEIEALESYEVRRVFSGTVRSRRASQLGFERPGGVAKVFVEEGDFVEEGQLIAQLDTSQLRAARRKVSAGLRQAQAGVGISTLTADRLSQLADEQYITLSEQAKVGEATSLDVSTALLALAEAKLEQINAQHTYEFAKLSLQEVMGLFPRAVTEDQTEHVFYETAK